MQQILIYKEDYANLVIEKKSLTGGKMEILAGILIIGFVISIIGYFKLKEKIRRGSNLLFGTDSFTKGWSMQEAELASTPKSVSSMTRIYLPLIETDFPEFNYFEFKQKAENMLKSVFNAIENQEESLLVNASRDLKDQVSTYINDLKSQNLVQRYDDVKIHQTEIYKYQKEAGTCIIVFQMAIQYYRYRLKEGVIVNGRRDLKVQTKYNVNLIYIQDVTKIKDAGYTQVLGIICPSCGAPVTSLGQKNCAYCGIGLKEINIHTWVLNKYEEIK